MSGAEIDWRTNARTLASNIIFVLLWVSAWFCVEFFAEQYTTDKKKLLIIYMGIFILACLLVLIVG